MEYFPHEIIFNAIYYRRMCLYTSNCVYMRGCFELIGFDCSLYPTSVGNTNIDIGRKFSISLASMLLNLHARSLALVLWPYFCFFFHSRDHHQCLSALPVVVFVISQLWIFMRLTFIYFPSVAITLLIISISINDQHVDLPLLLCVWWRTRLFLTI